MFSPRVRSDPSCWPCWFQHFQRWLVLQLGTEKATYSYVPVSTHMLTGGGYRLTYSTRSESRLPSCSLQAAFLECFKSQSGKALKRFSRLGSPKSGPQQPKPDRLSVQWSLSHPFSPAISIAVRGAITRTKRYFIVIFQGAHIHSAITGNIPWRPCEVTFFCLVNSTVLLKSA